MEEVGEIIEAGDGIARSKVFQLYVG